jgi:hypothetical protein
MKPKAQFLKVEIKIHLPSAPIRPITNNVHTPSYKLVKDTHYNLKKFIYLKTNLILQTY